MPKRNDEEFRLTCMVADLLRLLVRPGVHSFHIPNGENRSARTGARLKRMGVRAGEPDFVILVNGRAHGLELKPNKYRYQSPEQKAVQGEWEAAGGVYRMAKGYDEAVAFLLEIDAIKPIQGNKRFEPRSVTEGREAA